MPKTARQYDREIANYIAKHRPKHVRVAVRPGTYRGQSGYRVTGRDYYSRAFSIFAQTKAGAEEIRQLYYTQQDPSKQVDAVLMRGS